MQIAPGVGVNGLFKDPIVVDGLVAAVHLNGGFWQPKFFPGSELPFLWAVVPFTEESNASGDAGVGVLTTVDDYPDALLEVLLPVESNATVELVLDGDTINGESPHTDFIAFVTTPEQLEEVVGGARVQPQPPC